MAFATLNELRALLNADLGISDGNTVWGATDAVRNIYIQQGIRRLWPRVARLTRESVTISADTLMYTLTGIQDVLRIDELDTDGIVRGRINSWQLVVDESATGDVPVRRLLLPVALSTDVSLHVYGYQPYAIPATGTDTCDLPENKEHVAIVAARVEAMRSRWHAYLEYEQRAVANPTTATQMEDFRQAYMMARAELDQLLRDHERDASAARRAVPSRA